MRRLVVIVCMGVLSGCGSASRPQLAPAPAADPVRPEDPPAAVLAAPSPAPEPAPTVVLHGVGDITLGGRLEPYLDAMAARSGDRAAAMAYPLQQIGRLLADADLTVANLEGTFAVKSPRMNPEFAFKARPELAQILVAGGIDGVALGNNHIMDYGPGGVVETIAALDAVGIGWSGAGRDVAEARRAWRTEVRGLRLGFLSYKVTGRHDVAQAPTGTVFHADGPTVAWCHFDWPCILDLVTTDVAALAREVDVVVVSFHWGEERKYHAAPYQVALAHAAVDHGAHVIFGSHPHVLQGVERYGRAVIFYSLGNFLFGGTDAPFDPVGGLARVVVDRDGVVSAELKPVLTTQREAPFQPVLLTGEAAARALSAVAERSRSFAATLPELTLDAP